jgi:hypothetical protein
MRPSSGEAVADAGKEIRVCMLADPLTLTPLAVRKP